MSVRNLSRWAGISLLVVFFFMPLAHWFFFDGANWWLLVAFAGAWVAEEVYELE